MKKVYIFSIILLSLLEANSQSIIVIDKRAIKTVGKNSASAIAKEKLIQKSMAETRKAQESILKYTTIMKLNLERIEKARLDVSAFREGTHNIKILALLLKETLIELKDLSSDLPKYPFGTLAYSNHIKSIREHIISVGASVVDAVSNGEVTLSGVPVKSKVANLIDPVKRLEIINRCIYELQRVHSLIRDIRYNLYMRNTLRDASETLVPTAVLGTDVFRQICNDVVRLWTEESSSFY